MGFDAETKEGHRVYWPEKRSVTVERSVSFRFEPEEVVVDVLPLEGEGKDYERLVTNESERENIVLEIVKIPEAEPVPETEATEGREKHIRKETEYI